MSTYADQYPYKRYGSEPKYDGEQSFAEALYSYPNEVANMMYMQATPQQYDDETTVQISVVSVEVIKEVSVEVPVVHEISVEVPIEVVREVSVEVPIEVSVEVPVEVIKEISVITDTEQMKLNMISNIADQLCTIVWHTENPQPISVAQPVAIVYG